MNEHEEIFGSLAKTQAVAFGQLLTAPSNQEEQPLKAAKLDGGKRGRQQWGGQNNSQPSRPSGGNRFGGNQPPKAKGQAALIKAMGRLLIRQETAIQVLKQNSAWHVYLQPGPQGPIPLLFQASEAYRNEAKSKPMDIPLRAQLLHTLFQTVLHCLQAMSASEDQQKAAQAKGWMTAEGKWVYQRWDPAGQVLVADTDRAPMAHQDLVGLMGSMAEAVKKKDIIHRFNATHTVTADQVGTSKFLLEVGLRAPGVMDVWQGLEQMQNLSALQLCGMQLRRDGLSRSDLANDIQKMLNEC
ncbi:unnamed protein product [Symbiodinium sp. CCMP2592]|nr:unnamed protein product [Symbiodinium sp. CCMP2592]